MERQQYFQNALQNWCNIIEQNTQIPRELYGDYKVKRGLRNADGTGVLAGLTRVGSVSGYVMVEEEKTPIEGRLSYRGINVRDIVEACAHEKRFGFEEVCYLLLFARLPNQTELDDFCSLLGELRPLPYGFTEDMIMKAPSKNIMNKLARSVLASYSYDPDPESSDLYNLIRQSILLIARMPTIVAYSYQAKAHYHDGKSLYIHAPQKELSTSENLLYMLRPDNKYTELEAYVLDMCLMLHAEHGGGNNSAFATRVVTSSGSDTYSAIAAAIGSLKGPRHGGANAKVMGMVEDFKQSCADITNEAEIANHIEKILKKEAYDHSGLIYGMGHAVYTLSDPRTGFLKEKARELAEYTGRQEEYILYDTIERLTPAIYAELKGPKVMAANVDLYSGFIYSMLGIPEELYTPLFAVSRIVGWCAHRIEEVLYGGKIIRPAYKSVCKKSKYVPIAERE